MGHPDKVADQISDAVLDFCLKADPASRVACETLVTTDLAVVAGEITTKANLTRQAVDTLVREVIAEIGYVAKDQADLRKTGKLKWLRPDAKSQVTVEYNADGTPSRIHTVVLSTQHTREVMVTKDKLDYFTDEARQMIIDQLIKPTLEAERKDLVKGKLVMVVP